MKNKKPPFEITKKIISEIAEICELICKYLKKHDFITNADVRELLGVSSATATRVLAEAAKKRIA